MRRLLRWVMHGVIVLLCLITLLSLIAWPLSIHWRQAWVRDFYWRQVDLNRTDGPWYRVSDFRLNVAGGMLRLGISPFSINSTGYAADHPIALGFVDSAKLQELREHHRTWELIDNQGAWTSTFLVTSLSSQLLDIRFHSPLWLLASLCGPPGLLGITFWFIVPLFVHRTRLQTNLCLHCGYNLTGVKSDTCPECGAARPMVTVRESA